MMTINLKYEKQFCMIKKTLGGNCRHHVSC